MSLTSPYTFLWQNVARLLAALAIAMFAACKQDSKAPGASRSVAVIVEPDFVAPDGIPFDPLQVFADDLRRRLYEERGYRAGDDVRVRVSARNADVVRGFMEFPITIETDGEVVAFAVYYVSDLGGDHLGDLPDGALIGLNGMGQWDKAGIEHAALLLALSLRRSIGPAPQPPLGRQRSIQQACAEAAAETVTQSRKYPNAHVFVTGQEAMNWAPYWVAERIVESAQLVVLETDIARVEALMHPRNPVLAEAVRGGPGPEQRYYLLRAPGIYEMALSTTGDPLCRDWQELVDRLGEIATSRIIGPGQCLAVRTIQRVSAPLEIRIDPDETSGRQYEWGRFNKTVVELRDREAQTLLARQIERGARWSDAAGMPEGVGCEPAGPVFSTYGAIRALLGLE